MMPNDDCLEYFFDAESFYSAAGNVALESVELLRLSGNILGFHDDPFNLPVWQHRQFRNLGETDYSDWLAWVLLLAARRHERPAYLFERLFGAPHQTPPLRDQGRSCIIQREQPVPLGHDGRAGRLDILVLLTEKTWHIEVKMCDADSADLGKHNGYVESLKNCPNCDHVLLVTEHLRHAYPVDLDHPDGPRFVPLRWEDLCLRLRSWVAEAPQKGLVEATILFFCSIVEQTLLGMNANSLRQAKYIEKSLGEINGNR